MSLHALRLAYVLLILVGASACGKKSSETQACKADALFQSIPSAPTLADFPDSPGQKFAGRPALAAAHLLSSKCASSLASTTTLFDELGIFSKVSLDKPADPKLPRRLGMELFASWDGAGDSELGRCVAFAEVDGGKSFTRAVLLEGPRLHGCIEHKASLVLPLAEGHDIVLLATPASSVHKSQFAELALAVARSSSCVLGSRPEISLFPGIDTQLNYLDDAGSVMMRGRMRISPHGVSMDFRSSVEEEYSGLFSGRSFTDAEIAALPQVLEPTLFALIDRRQRRVLAYAERWRGDADCGHSAGTWEDVLRGRRG